MSVLKGVLKSSCHRDLAAAPCMTYPSCFLFIPLPPWAFPRICQTLCCLRAIAHLLPRNSHPSVLSLIPSDHCSEWHLTGVSFSDHRISSSCAHHESLPTYPLYSHSTLTTFYGLHIKIFLFVCYHLSPTLECKL